MGHAPARNPRLVAAEKFEVVDEEGRPRATLGMVKGDAALTLSSPDGKPLLTLRTLRDGGSGLYLQDANGRPRGELALAPRGPVLNFVGENSATRMHLTGAGPASLFELFREDGRPILTVTEGKLRVYDAEGKDVAFEKP
jgi:hypothetical protein